LSLTPRASRPTRMAQRDQVLIVIHVDDQDEEDRWARVIELLLEAGETETTEVA
jgi:hypothetical protein